MYVFVQKTHKQNGDKNWTKCSQDWVEINVFPVISEAQSLKLFWWSVPLNPLDKIVP